MDLVNYYNSICPKINVGHAHRTATKKEYTNNKLYRIKSCFLCDEEKQKNTVLNFHCENYLSVITIKPSKELIKLVTNIFSANFIDGKKNKYFLPTELHNMIFYYCINTYKQNIIRNINKDTIKHMSNCSCKLCKNRFFKYAEFNSCSHHVIPRQSRFN